MVTAEEWADIERRHANRLRSDPGSAVSWVEFLESAEDMIQAEREFNEATKIASDHLDRLVPPEDRYCGWYCYASEPILAIYGLFTDTPNSIHPSDFRFSLSYGKAARSPLGWMQRRAKEFRSHARKVKRTLAVNLILAEQPAI